MTTPTLETVAAVHGLTPTALQWQFDRMDEGATLVDAARALNAAQLHSPLTLCDVAACLWEATLDALGDADNPAHCGADRYRKANGTATMRCMIVQLAPECEAAWLALGDDGQDDAGCFDWDFCPKWLAARMGWSEPDSASAWGCARCGNTDQDGTDICPDCGEPA